MSVRRVNSLNSDEAIIGKVKMASDVQSRSV